MWLLKHKRYIILLLALLGVETLIAFGAVYYVVSSEQYSPSVNMDGVSFDALPYETLAEEEHVMVPVEGRIQEEEAEVVTEDTEEKRSINDRLLDVESMSPGGNTGYIFVGDSRFVNMNDICGISKLENCFMVAKVGEGYRWFQDTGLSQIKKIVSSKIFPQWKLIICLGINDLENLDKYVKKYEALKEDYDITLVSVNPITHYGNLSNEAIEKFNSTLQKQPFPYIDTYHILMTTGYTTTDGLHYNGDTTRKIYHGILLGLEDFNPGCLTADPEGILDNNALGKKKSIQSDILAENKYVRPEPQISEEEMQELLKKLNEEGSTAPGTDPAAGVQTPEQPAPPPEWTEPPPEPPREERSEDEDEDEDEDDEDD